MDATNFEPAFAGSDLLLIDKVPALASVGDLPGTAGAFLNDASDLFDPFKIEKSKVGTLFEIVCANVSASVDSLGAEASTAGLAVRGDDRRTPGSCVAPGGRSV